MAKTKNQPVLKKKKTLPWQGLLAVAVLVVAVAAYVIWESPTEKDLDLSVIDKGVNVVVQVHDPN
ncbi:MAG: hypothetical protein HQM13_10145 [SAR324 cluster bacterium]|nr:hypothetical protein [SAR324 cluster bacterium]